MANEVSSVYINGKIMLLQIDGTGTAAVRGPDNKLVTLTDNGTGDYTLTFSPVLSQPPMAFVMPLTDDVMISQQAAPTTSVLRFECRGIEKTAVLSLEGIKFHSSLSGADGNDITIQITDGASAGSEVVTATDAGVIVIQVETGVSTATQVYAALTAGTAEAAEALNYVTAEVITGAETWATAAAAPLAGGVNGGAVDCEFDILVVGA